MSVRQVKRYLGLLVTLVIITVFMVIPVSAQKTFRWKMQTLWSAGEPPYVYLQDFCKHVKIMTNGRLEITPFPAGAVVPTFDTLEATQHDILQVMNVWPGYFTGKDPAFALVSDPICAYKEPWEFEEFYYNRGGQELLNELYKPYGVVSIGAVLWGMESMPLKFPARKPEDFKGHKIRSPQGLTADLLRELGAGVVVIPGEEVYSALDKGVVDGADWGTPSCNHKMGFDTVAKYFIYPGFRSIPLSDVVINEKEWDKLPADIKEIVKVAVHAWNEEQLRGLHVKDIIAVNEMKASGCIALSWSEENINRIREITKGIWKKWSKKSPMAKKAYDLQIKWLKELGRIK